MSDVREKKITAIVLDPVAKKHVTGTFHPESPKRYDAILAALKAAELLDRCEAMKPVPVKDEAILRCHKKLYLNLVLDECKDADDRETLSTGDTVVSGGSLTAARHSAGAPIVAVDAVMDGKVSNAFCLMRPPGHHATPSRGMGFCFFNNVAIAARHAQAKHDIERVLIVDWDVHHGNGTQDIFYEDGSVFFFSTHQSPWYPHTGKAEETGKGEGEGATLNCPFPAGTGMKDIGDAFYHKLAPAMEKFKPQFIFISAGFDSRVDDPLGRFKLEDKDFVTLTNVLLDMADKYAEGRVVSVLEGGYNLEGLAKSATAHVGALMKA